MPLYNILFTWWTWEERGIRYRQLRNNGADPKLAGRGRDLSPTEYGKILRQLITARTN